LRLLKNNKTWPKKPPNQKILQPKKNGKRKNKNLFLMLSPNSIKCFKKPKNIKSLKNMETLTLLSLKIKIISIRMIKKMMINKEINNKITIKIDDFKR
jgi:hypothetical protein